MGLEAKSGGGTKEKKEEKEEKFALCESIGHRPLRGRCPKTETRRLTKIEGAKKKTYLIERRNDRVRNGRM